MAKIIIRASARRDFIAIGREIAKDNPPRAKSFVAELKDRCLNLSEFPERGSLREELSVNIRQLVHRNYLIFYRYNGDKDLVSILHVFSRYRDITADNIVE